MVRYPLSSNSNNELTHIKNNLGPNTERSVTPLTRILVQPRETIGFTL